MAGWGLGVALIAAALPGARPARGQPVNDLCQQAETLVCDTPVTVDNTDATTSTSDPTFSCYFGGPAQGVGSVWYKFVATSASATVRLCDSEVVDTLLAVYRVGNPANHCQLLIQLGCNDDGCNLRSAVCVENLTMGDTYYVQVASFTGAHRGSFTLELTCSCAPPATGACCFTDGTCSVVMPSSCSALGGSYVGDGADCSAITCDIAPPNNTCFNATPLTPPANVIANTAAATTDRLLTCGVASTPSKGIWYSVVGTGHSMTASTCNPGTDFDTKIQVFCGVCLETVCIDGNDDAIDAPPECDINGANRKSQVTWCTNAGSTYYIVVGGFSGQFGNFELTLTDNGMTCMNPRSCVPRSGACCMGGACTVMPKGECDSAGGTYIADNITCAEGRCTQGGCCFPDSNTCAVVTQADCTAAGGVYRGNATHCDPLKPCQPVNEACATAQAITTLPFSLTVDTKNVAADGPAALCDPSRSGSPLKNDIWYSWSPATTCYATFTATEGDYDSILTVWQGPDCGNLTRLYCVDEPEPLVVKFIGVAGTTYWFQIGDTGAIAGGGATTVSLTCLSGSGACCDTAGACTVQSAVNCIMSGGDYRGDGTTCSPNGCPQPPVNDTCSAATNLAVLPASIPGSTFLAMDDMVPLCFIDAPSQGVWYKVTGTGTTIKATTCNGGTTFDTKLAVFCGDCLNLICIGGNDDDPSGTLPECRFNSANLRSTVTWCSQAGTTYYILVGGFPGVPGNFRMIVTQDGMSCSDAISCTVPTGACCEGMTCGIDSPGACAAAGGHYLGDGATCGAGACSDGGCCFSDGACSLLTAEDCGGAGGSFQGYGTTCAPNLCEQPPPVNDACAGAATIDCGTVAAIDNTYATEEPGDPVLACHFGGPAPGVGTVWYKFVANDTSARVSTCGSASPVNDTLIGVFSVDEMDPCNTLTPIGCSEDACGASGFLSRVCVNGLTIGATYYIQAASYAEVDQGVIDVELVCPCPECSVVCDPMSVAEGEPDCFDGYVDETNGGCGAAMPAFSSISCGGMICGSAGTYLVELPCMDDNECPAGQTCDTGAGTCTGGPYPLRDSDWYEVVLSSESQLTWTVTAEFDVEISMVLPDSGPDPCGPGSAVLASAQGSACETASVGECLPAGVYWLAVSPQDSAVAACPSTYTAEAACAPCPTGACCFADGSCAGGLQQAMCESQGGSYDGDGTVCTPNPCAQPPVNDLCVNAIPVGNGATAFSTLLAGTDGPNEPTACGFFGDTQVSSDIWFCYNAFCNSDLTVSLCDPPGANFDTKLAVYDGCACPPGGAPLACNDDSCDLRSEVTFPATAGGTYLIRVGGYAGDRGAGTLTIACQTFCPQPVLAFARSLAVHSTETGPQELYVDLNLAEDPVLRTSEPRTTGIQTLEFGFTAPVPSATVAITCSDGTQAGGPLTGLPGMVGRIDLGAPLPNRTVARISVNVADDPGCSESLCAVSLVGDFDDNDQVTAADKGQLSGFIFQPIAQANARYDMQVGGATFIDVADLAAWTGFFGTSASGISCPDPGVRSIGEIPGTGDTTAGAATPEGEAAGPIVTAGKRTASIARALAEAGSASDAGPEAGTLPMFVLSTADSLTRVSQTDMGPPSFLKYSAIQPQYSATVFAAGRETTSLQLIVKNVGGVDLPGVRVDPIDFDPSRPDPRTGGIAVEVSREHYVNVNTPTWGVGGEYGNQFDESLGIGKYPDALVPFNGPNGASLESAIPLAPSGTIYRAITTIPPNACQTYWLDIAVPPTTAPGTYTGRIQVTSGAVSQMFELTVHVWSFTLPVQPSQDSYFGLPNRVQDLYGDTAAAFDPTLRQIETMYHQHRLALSVSGIVSRQIYSLYKFDKTIGRVVFSDDQTIRDFKARYVDPINLQHITVLFRPQYENRVNGTYVIFTGSPWSDYAGMNADAARDFIRDLDQVILDYDLPPAFVVIDEPKSKDSYRAIVDIGLILRDAVQHGKVKLMVLNPPTPLDPDWPVVAEYVDIWGVTMEDFNQTAADEAKAAGSQIWSYTALTKQFSGLGSWFVDLSLLNFRSCFWANWVAGAVGVHHWEAQWWAAPNLITDYNRVWEDAMTLRQGTSILRYNGYGSFTYDARLVGFKGLVPSIRLKAIRDGVNDVDYLKILRDLGGKTHLITDGLFMEQIQDPENPFRNMSRDASLYLQARIALGQAIEAKLNP